jgi:putative NADPH-quinone reductase
MRILIVFAHPTRNSFCGAILTAALQELAANGHETELVDLYTEEFNPVLSECEWASYGSSLSPGIQSYVDQIHRADGLIWIFPTWNHGLPAILKGYVDRVWKPNVAFEIDDTRKVRFDSLGNLKFFVVVTTYGGSWLASTFVGNPCKRVISPGLRRHLSLFSSFTWLALYRMDEPSADNLNHFIAKVRQTVRKYSRQCADSRSTSPARSVPRLCQALWEWLCRYLPAYGIMP